MSQRVTLKKWHNILKKKKHCCHNASQRVVTSQKCMGKKKFCFETYFFYSLHKRKNVPNDFLFNHFETINKTLKKLFFISGDTFQNFGQVTCPNFCKKKLFTAINRTFFERYLIEKSTKINLRYKYDIKSSLNSSQLKN